MDCLLDTGSQVTTVPLSFYENNLKEQQIWPLDDLLEVEGANGQEVPYFGYMHLDITFPKEFVGLEAEVATLALVVPDMREGAEEQLLIGLTCCIQIWLLVLLMLTCHVATRQCLKSWSLDTNRGKMATLGW